MTTVPMLTASAGPGVVVLVLDPETAEHLASVLYRSLAPTGDNDDALIADGYWVVAKIRSAAADAVGQAGLDDGTTYVPFHPASTIKTLTLVREMTS